MDKYKRRLVTSAEEDRISNLPENLIYSILERLPVQDAIKTNILSKNWRYRWTTMTKLVLDKQFSDKFTKMGAFDPNGFIRITNQVLNLHKGPILKLHLHLPSIILDSFQEVDQWILLLSRNGVRELILINSNQRYHLPSYMFLCIELRKLQLENCILKPPREFQGFLFLEDLFLTNIDFGANLYGTMITLPQLKNLTVHTCINFYNFNIKSPVLENLIVMANSDRSYQLPSFVYSCIKLRMLRLRACIFNQPVYFINLEELFLSEVKFGATLVIKLPQLRFLSMLGCMNDDNLNIQATKLQTLLVFFSGPDAKLLQLSHSECLSNVLICKLKPIQGFALVEPMKLVTYFRKFPKTLRFFISGDLIEFLVAEKVPRWLNSDLVNRISRRTLIYIKLGDLDELQGALWMLRNYSSNIERLSVFKNKGDPDMILDEQPAISYLEDSDCLNQTLNQLKYVNISWIEGSRAELLFIKLLMAHSPILEKMMIQLSGPAVAHKSLAFAKEVISFRRASTKAQVFFSRQSFKNV